MKTSNRRERKNAVPVPSGIHSFGQFDDPGRSKQLADQLVNMTQVFTSQVTFLCIPSSIAFLLVRE